MSKKKTGLFISFLLMATLIPLVQADISTTEQRIDEGYILDQMQTEDGFYYGVTMDNPAAQRFQPTLTPLAKVRLLIRLEGSVGPTEQIELSIRRYLDGPDLTSVRMNAVEISDEETWVNFDFDDITVSANESYYMILTSYCQNAEFRWFSMQNMDMDLYTRGDAWYLDASGGGVITWLMFPTYTDFCFKTYSYAGKDADLSCYAVFGWPDQLTGSTITDSFTIRNIGDSQSLLNWEIQSVPEWGVWEFDPDHGVDLTPEDGELTIDITVTVPEEQNQMFSGEIIIVNQNNESDTGTIIVSLSTEKTRMLWFSEFISLFWQRILVLINPLMG